MTLSLLELRHIIESGFLPMQCRCTADLTNDLTLEIMDHATGRNLVVGGINVATLGTSRVISGLIGELRAEVSMVSREGILRTTSMK